MAKTHIALHVDLCGRDFVSLKEALSQNENFATQISPQRVQDEFDRFKLWAGNIAAHRKGRRSLEYRLRDAAHLKKETHKLLDSLKSSLQASLEIIGGERTPWDEIPESESESESDSDEDASDTTGLQGDTELKQLAASITSSITCLFRLSMAVRDPAPDNQSGSAIIVDKTVFYEPLDVRHVEEKFSLQKSFLTERLGRGISGRRQYLSYRETHAEKLAKNVETIGFEEPRTEHTNNSTEASPLPHKVAASADPRYSKTDIAIDNDDEILSQTSYAPTENATMRVPSLPREARDQECFECPLCFMIVSIHTKRAWKQHVYRDLHPYCCTFEHCATASRLFDSRHSWFQHELEAHRFSWQCVDGCEQVCHSERDFELHIRSSHPDMSEGNMLAALKKTSTRPANLTDSANCPLCHKSMTLRMLQKHLGHHQEQLALFALPPNLDATEDDLEDHHEDATTPIGSSEWQDEELSDASDTEDVVATIGYGLVTEELISSVSDRQLAEYSKYADFLRMHEISTLTAEAHRRGLVFSDLYEPGSDILPLNALLEDPTWSMGHESVKPSITFSNSRNRPCDACYRRSSRCVFAQDNDVCLLCRYHNSECTFVVELAETEATDSNSDFIFPEHSQKDQTRSLSLSSDSQPQDLLNEHTDTAPFQPVSAEAEDNAPQVAADSKSDEFEDDHHRQYRDNLQKELEKSLGSSSATLAANLAQGEADRQASKMMALDAKKSALQDALNRTIINGGHSFKAAAFDGEPDVAKLLASAETAREGVDPEAVEETKGSASAHKKAIAEAEEVKKKVAKSEPIESRHFLQFTDAINRKFSFPLHICKTWEAMKELIEQAFIHVDIVGSHVRDGHYDLVTTDGEIISPQYWESMIQPGWHITMYMWPMPGPLPEPLPNNMDDKDEQTGPTTTLHSEDRDQIHEPHAIPRYLSSAPEPDHGREQDGKGKAPADHLPLKSSVAVDAGHVLKGSPTDPPISNDGNTKRKIAFDPDLFDSLLKPKSGGLSSLSNASSSQQQHPGATTDEPYLGRSIEYESTSSQPILSSPDLSNPPYTGMHNMSPRQEITSGNTNIPGQDATEPVGISYQVLKDTYIQRNEQIIQIYGSVQAAPPQHQQMLKSLQLAIRKRETEMQQGDPLGSYEYSQQINLAALDDRDSTQGQSNLPTSRILDQRGGQPEGSLVSPDDKQTHQAQLPGTLKSSPSKRLTKEQRELLEAHFQMQHYPVKEEILSLKRTLDLPSETIHIWFQNRRVRAKQDSRKTLTKDNTRLGISTESTEKSDNDLILLGDNSRRHGEESAEILPNRVLTSKSTPEPRKGLFVDQDSTPIRHARTPTPDMSSAEQSEEEDKEDRRDRRRKISLSEYRRGYKDKRSDTVVNPGMSSRPPARPRKGSLVNLSTSPVVDDSEADSAVSARILFANRRRRRPILVDDNDRSPSPPSNPSAFEDSIDLPSRPSKPLDRSKFKKSSLHPASRSSSSEDELSEPKRNSRVRPRKLDSDLSEDKINTRPVTPPQHVREPAQSNDNEHVTQPSALVNNAKCEVFAITRNSDDPNSKQQRTEYKWRCCSCGYGYNDYYVDAGCSSCYNHWRCA